MLAPARNVHHQRGRHAVDAPEYDRRADAGRGGPRRVGAAASGAAANRSGAATAGIYFLQGGGIYTLPVAGGSARPGSPRRQPATGRAAVVVAAAAALRLRLHLRRNGVRRRGSTAHSVVGEDRDPDVTARSAARNTRRGLAGDEEPFLRSQMHGDRLGRGQGQVARPSCPTSPTPRSCTT